MKRPGGPTVPGMPGVFPLDEFPIHQVPAPV